jgi:hypothetical protein
MLARQGWAIIGATVAVFVSARLFGLIELYLLGCALVLLLAISVIGIARPLPRLAVHRVAQPELVAVGEPSRVDLAVANVSHRRAPRLSLWETVGSSGGAAMQMAPLRSGQTVAATYRVPSDRRGVVVLGPLRADRTDLFGLCRRRMMLPGTAEVLVVPERVPLGFPGLGSSGRLGDHLRMKSWGQTGSEFHSQREYVPGDDLRRINWKSSARRGDLIVRETALEGLQRCTVVLDTMADAYADDDAFERAVTAAASVVAGAVAAGVATRLVAPGIDLRGPDVAHESLRWLAMVELGSEMADHTTSGRTRTDGLGLLVVVSGRSDAAAVATTRTNAAPDDTVLVVTTGEPPLDGARFAVDGTSLDSLQQSWTRLVMGTAAVRA